MGKKYIVKALSVGGLRNKIFKSGEVVTEDAFGKERTDELIKGGFIVEDAVKKYTAEEKIEMIQSANSISEVKDILSEDSRKSVVKAGADKIETILIEAIETAQDLETLEAMDEADMNKDVKAALEAKKEEFTK